MGIDVVFPAEEEDVIDQSDKVKGETAQHMSQRGWLFDNVHEKLGLDNICFSCKNKMEKGKELKLTTVADVPKGLIAFVGLCEKCSKKFEKEVEKKGEK